MKKKEPLVQKVGENPEPTEHLQVGDFLYNPGKIYLFHVEGCEDTGHVGTLDGLFEGDGEDDTPYFMSDKCSWQCCTAIWIPNVENLGEVLHTSVMNGQHVDDFIDYGLLGESQEGKEPEPNVDYARWVLDSFRRTAILKWAFEPFMKHHPLFCTYEGKRYRCIGGSRMGDVWLTTKFGNDTGYEKRVGVDSCSEWGPSPEFKGEEGPHNGNR